VRVRYGALSLTMFFCRYLGVVLTNSMVLVFTPLWNTTKRN
jgi:hypothetical protein